MKNISKTIATTLLITASSLSSAALLPSATTTGAGSYNNIGYINDGSTPTESTHWKRNDNTTWWTERGTVFTLDYGSSFNITDIDLSVSHNDGYRIQWSLDNTSWSTLFDVNAADGEQVRGMDTMSGEWTLCLQSVALLNILHP